VNSRIRPRLAGEVAVRRLGDARGVIVNGPRQAGKTELLRLIHRQLGGTLLTLDQPQLLRAARTDPTGFVEDRPTPLMIDEVQRGGNPLILAIKVLLDSASDRGQIVLAGSTRFLTEPRLSESLAGRVRFVDLWPFSQGEVDELGPAGDRLLDRVVTSSDALLAWAGGTAPITRREVFHRVCTGGFPEAVLANSDRARAEFFADYVRTISQRDITELGRISDRVELPLVLRLLAERTAGLLNANTLAQAVGTSADSMRRYLPLVETIFLTYRLPAFASTSAARTRRRPKLHLTDSGLAAWLLGVTADRLLDPAATVAGPLLETFVLMELVKQQTWSDQQVRISHYRDAAGREVDIVVETPDGRVAGIEVKAAIDVDERDVRSLTYLRDRLGDRFVVGVVLHCGRGPARWGDRLVSIPVGALWSGDPS
jgi:predicted AAA+ superfamily ATPase